MKNKSHFKASCCAIAATFCLAAIASAQAQQQAQSQAPPPSQNPKSRRSQRVVPLPEIQVTSPDGTVRFSLLPGAERLRIKVTLGDATVIEASPLAMHLGGYDLSSGVVLGKLERYEIKDTYPHYGAHSLAINRCNGVKIELVHDLSFTNYTLEVRVFNDGVAYRHILPGEENVSRVPDEYSTFMIPAGSTAWYHDLDGHYEAEYSKKEVAEVQAGEWAGPPMTFKLTVMPCWHPRRMKQTYNSEVRDRAKVGITIGANELDI